MTGKTTTLTRWLERQAQTFGRQHVMACSFTRAAAWELAGRNQILPEQNIGTLHALCYRALGCPELTQKHLKEWNAAYPAYALSRTALDPNSPLDDAPEKATFGDDCLALLDVCRARRHPRPWPLHVDSFARSWRDWKEQCHYLDFTDLLERCLADVAICPGHPIAFCLDEAQDCSRLQLDLVLHWARQMRRILCALDEDQALYSWAGADPDAVIALCRSLPPDHVTVLSQSYRVPVAVHARASAWIAKASDRLLKPYQPRDAPGTVATCSATWKRPEEAVALALGRAGSGRTVMFLASCSYMLGPLMAVLRDQAVPYHNPYRHNRADWNPLTPGSANRMMAVDRVLAFLRPDPATCGDQAQFWTRDDFFRFGSCLAARGLFQHGAKELIKAWRGDARQLSADDLQDVLTVEGCQELDDRWFHTPEDVRASLDWLRRHLTGTEEKRFAYPIKVAHAHGGKQLLETPRLIVGTGHSVKGGESSTVFVWPDLSFAGAHEWLGGRGDAVRRLFYVMMTRARDELVLCAPTTPLHVDLS